MTLSSVPATYPTAQNGFYVDEPIHGEMVRAALRLGFHVIAYDADEGDVDARERASAQSLYDQVFKRDPAARLVVNAGFSHIQKSGNPVGAKSMAENFATLSGIEPLSIEQTMMIEHPRAADDHPYYRTAVDAAQATAPFVYVSDTGGLWSLKPGRYDVSVFFPPETRDDGRPIWVALGGTRHAVSVSGADCLGRFPCLIEARHATEGDDAVAADRVRLDADARSRVYLYPGDYRLSSIDLAGKTILTRAIHVDAP